MKNYLLLICLLLFTGSLSAQLSQAVTPDNPDNQSNTANFPNTSLEVNLHPITDYVGPQPFSLKLTQGNQDDRIFKLTFDLTIGGPQNPDNDFRWTANQIYEALDNELVPSSCGKWHYFDNISVAPENTLNNDDLDHQFEVSFTIHHYDGLASKDGFMDPCGWWKGKGDIVHEMDVDSDKDDIITEDEGCGNCNAETDNVEGADDNGNEEELDEDSDTAPGEDCEQDANQRLAKEDFNVILYPNPTSGQLNIEVSKEVHSMKIYDCNSRLVSEFMVDSYDQIDISSLAIGIYKLQTTFESGVVKTDRIVLIK